MSAPIRSESALVGRVAQVQRALSRLSTALYYLTWAVASVLLMFFVTALFLQVLYRYVLKAPLPWTEEAAGFALVWYAMIAAALAALEGQQFVFRWGVGVLPFAIQRALRQATTLVIIGFLVVLLQQGRQYLEIVSGQYGPATNIPLSIPYFALPLGSGFLIAVYALDLLDGLCSWVTGDVLSRREQHEMVMTRRLKSDDETDSERDNPDDV